MGFSPERKSFLESQNSFNTIKVIMSGLKPYDSVYYLRPKGRSYTKEIYERLKSHASVFNLMGF
jgi:hypothetical protein